MIRPATQQDIDALYGLYQKHNLDKKKLSDPSYVTEIQQQGFIFGSDTKEEFSREVTESNLTLLTDEKEVTSFVLINRETYFPEEADNVVWVRQDLKDTFFHSDSTRTIHQLVVHPDFKRNKQASRLISHAAATLKKQDVTHLFSIIMIFPIANMPSVPFHSKNGFEVAAITYPRDILGFEKYMSVLFCKRL